VPQTRRLSDKIMHRLNRDPGMMARRRGFFGRRAGRGRHAGLALAGWVALGSPSVYAEGACRAPAQPMLAIELMFGRSVEGRVVVPDRAWASFLAREVTPRFSEGLSVVDAAGQFRTPGGQVLHEPSKLVVVIAPDKPETHDHIAAIKTAYK